MTISQLEPLIREKQLSPVELVQACLSQIRDLDGKFHAFITLLEESALSAANHAERSITSGGYLGPLHGIPIGFKDIYDVKGVRTTAGSRILADYVPKEDATSVANLRAAGGIPLGKLNLHQFAFGPTGVNPHSDTSRNPWNTERIPGGSSSGSGVALMAGMLPAATGTDTGGSIRIPAAICGVVGIKPTYGRISLRGIIPLSSSLDHPGPMARSVEDCAILLGAMAGYDPGDAKSIDSPIPDYRRGLKEPVNGLTAGVPREFFSKLQPGVRAAVETAIATLEDLGIAIREVDVPTNEEAWSISSKILGVEAAAYHHKWMNERPDEYDPQVLQRLQGGAAVSAVDYILAQQLRDDFSQRYRDSLHGVDVLVSPTEPITATVIGEDTVLVEGDTEPTLNQLVSLTRPHNLTGMPSMSVPCGFDEQGLPIGLQIAGKHVDEATVLRVAYAYEQATDWHSHRPTL